MGSRVSRRVASGARAARRTRTSVHEPGYPGSQQRTVVSEPRAGKREPSSGRARRAARPLPAILDPEVIRRYADATNDPNPRYQDGSAVPAAFPVMLVFDAQTAGNSAIPREAFRVIRAGVHGEHDLVLYRALVPGEELTNLFGGMERPRDPCGQRRDPEDRDARRVRPGRRRKQWWQTFLVGVDFGESQGPSRPTTPFPSPLVRSPSANIGCTSTSTSPPGTREVSGDWSAHHFDRSVATGWWFPRRVSPRSVHDGDVRPSRRRDRRRG